MNFIELKIKEF